MESEGSSSFCEQKEPKKLCDPGTWVGATAAPHAGASVNNIYVSPKTL
jgi:hypothetical protein